MNRFVVLWFLLTSPASGGVSVLSEVKAAMGGANWDRVKTLHVRGTLSMGDLKGTYESWLDLQHSRTYTDERFSSASLGSIRSMTGWNGKVSWSADQTGDVYIADSEEARRGALGSTYVDTFGYLFPSRFPADIAVAADATVRVKPRGADPFDLSVDPGTHMIRRIVRLKGVDRDTTAFSDFRPVGGLIVPFETTQIETRRIALVEINVAAPAGIFNPPQPALSGVEFPEGRNSVTVNFRYVDDQIYIPVSLNGRPLEKFLFDIGSTNTIDTAKAQALGLKVEAAGVSYGGGPDAAPAGLTKVDRLDIGGLRMVDQIVDTTVLGGGSDDEGTIGYELARRTVVTIDYASRQITFVKPQYFRKPAHAIAMPFRFAEKSQVLVDASVEGIRGEFQLDTGQGASLMINRPFAERHGLLGKYGSGREGAASGIGGVVKTVLFAPSRFTIGSLRPGLSEAEIMLATTGSGAQEHVAGTIGNGILKQFAVTLDYAHRMVYFEKNADFGKPDAGAEKETETFDMGRPDLQKSGREGWLGLIKMSRRVGEPLEILEIDPEGPSARAGIRRGDLIISVNGTPVEKLTGEQVARAFIASPGTEVKLTIRRDTGTREITIPTI